MTAPAAVLLLRNIIDDIADRNRLSAGIRACTTRQGDFGSTLEMELAGIAMIPEAREMLSDRLTEYWQGMPVLGSPSDYRNFEVVIGGGLHAAVYAASRVAMGFPRPVVLEQNSAEQVGGAFAMSLKPVFRLNSRNRPGSVGFPDQDRALNYLPGAPVQPSMITSEEYPTNADMAWTIRVALAQYADVRPGVTVTGVDASTDDRGIRVSTSMGDITAGRVLDARGTGTERDAGQADGKLILTFSQLMGQMGGMFPLQGMRQIAVTGGGDSAKCAVESLLGIAPGHTSPIGLDYPEQVDWYPGSGIREATCSEFRNAQRGRYIKIAQFLPGNESNPSTRLRVIAGQRGYPARMPDGVLVNGRSYDICVLCNGSTPGSIGAISGSVLSYFSFRASANGTTLALRADPFEIYRIGPTANLPFSDNELTSGIADIAENKVAMFRLVPRTAALAAKLGPPGE